MNDKDLSCWLTFEADGSILSAHCTCMAGLGEVCSHTAADALTFHFHNNTEEVACTDVLSAWPVPKVSKKIELKEIKDINWGKQTTSYNGIF